jgi:fatty-acid desaturase
MLIFFWCVAAYGCASIISWSAIFEELREWVKTKSSWFHKLMTCPLCLGFHLGWVMSLTLGGLCNHYFQTNLFWGLFADAVFTSGSTWIINSITEFFEESRIK